MKLNSDSFSDYIKKENLIVSKDKLICALSGGKDSVALLYLLKDLQSKMDFSIMAVHINHNIRGEEALRDQLFAENLCKKLGIDFKFISVNVPEYAEKEKLGIEEAARILRYDAFNKTAQYYGYNKIAVAHTLSDQAETVLFHIIRGTGIKGIGGMKPQNGNIIRPLLPFSTNDILEYINDNKIDHIFDSTNNDIQYSRNRIRNIIIPELQKINPKAEDAIFRLSSHARADEEFIQYRLSLLSEDPDIDALNELLKIKANYPLIYRYLFNICEKRGVFLDSERFDAVIKLIKNKTTDKIIQIEKGYFFRIKKDKLLLECKIETYDLAFEPQKLHLGENIINEADIRITLKQIIPQKNIKINKKLLNISSSLCKIKGSFFIRPYNNLDTIKMYSMTKNISKLFADAKIPKEYRKAIPVISDESEIIWVPFFGLCDKARISEQDDKAINFAIDSPVLRKIQKYI